jgi:hypothetical protein
MADRIEEIEQELGRSLTPDEEHLLFENPDAPVADLPALYDDDSFGGGF